MTFQKNVSHEKRVKEFLESFGPCGTNGTNERRELAGKISHDEWHEGHAKGCSDARSVTLYQLKKILTTGSYSETVNSKETNFKTVTTTYRLDSMDSKDRKTL